MHDIHEKEFDPNVPLVFVLVPTLNIGAAKAQGTIAGPCKQRPGHAAWDTKTERAGMNCEYLRRPHVLDFISVIPRFAQGLKSNSDGMIFLARTPCPSAHISVEKKLDQLTQPYIPGVMVIARVPILSQVQAGGLDRGFYHLDRVVAQEGFP